MAKWGDFGKLLAVIDCEPNSWETVGVVYKRTAQLCVLLLTFTPASYRLGCSVPGLRRLACGVCIWLLGDLCTSVFFLLWEWNVLRNALTFRMVQLRLLLVFNVLCLWARCTYWNLLTLCRDSRQHLLMDMYYKWDLTNKLKEHNKDLKNDVLVFLRFLLSWSSSAVTNNNNHHSLTMSTAGQRPLPYSSI